jgi:hypothetical protein
LHSACNIATVYLNSYMVCSRSRMGNSRSRVRLRRKSSALGAQKLGSVRCAPCRDWRCVQKIQGRRNDWVNKLQALVQPRELHRNASFSSPRSTDEPLYNSSFQRRRSTKEIAVAKENLELGAMLASVSLTWRSRRGAGTIRKESPFVTWDKARALRLKRAMAHSCLQRSPPNDVRRDRGPWNV